MDRADRTDRHHQAASVPDLIDGRYAKVRNIERDPRDAAFPVPRKPGYLVRYSVERIGGVGPWVPHT